MYQYSHDDDTPTTYAAKLISQGHTADEVRQIMQREKITFPSISEALNDFLGKKNLSVNTVASLSDMDPATIYRIMNRERNPSRNVIIRIAMALALNLEETQLLLKSGNCASLSASRARDLLIMDGIIHEKYYEEVNETLVNKGMADLNGRG